jgi:hypothetical protein
MTRAAPQVPLATARNLSEGGVEAAATDIPSRRRQRRRKNGSMHCAARFGQREAADDRALLFYGGPETGCDRPFQYTVVPRTAA